MELVGHNTAAAVVVGLSTCALFVVAAAVAAVSGSSASVAAVETLSTAECWCCSVYHRSAEAAAVMGVVLRRQWWVLPATAGQAGR